MSITPRFQLGDHVKIVRLGPNANRVGIVIEVDRSKLLPHYIVEFSRFYQERFPEFDLARLRESEVSEMQK